MKKPFKETKAVTNSHKMVYPIESRLIWNRLVSMICFLNCTVNLSVECIGKWTGGSYERDSLAGWWLER